jgi:hypothetical protein
MNNVAMHRFWATLRGLATVRRAKPVERGPQDRLEVAGVAVNRGEAYPTHVVLGLPAPYPADVAHWVTDELITTSARYSLSRG